MKRCNYPNVECGKAREICEMLDRVGGRKDRHLVQIAIKEGYIPLNITTE